MACQSRRNQGSPSQVIVFTNGCFDILHAGHVEYLQRSRELGSKLIVGLNSDNSVRRLKGPQRPVNTEYDRAFVLSALSCVDEVRIFHDDTPHSLIRQIRPDIITKGGDYIPEEVVGADIAKVIILPYVEGRSTSGVINAIKGNSC